MINTLKQLFPTLLLCVTVTSCASYSATTLETPSDFIAPQTEQLEVLDGTVTARVFQDLEPVEQYYSQDLLAKGILPVHLKFQNRDSQSVIEINPDYFKIVDSEGESFSALSIDQAISRAQFSHGQSAAWLIGFGIIGGAISASKITKANTALSEDYLEKGLSGTLLKPGSNVEGTVFFAVDSKVKSLDGSFLELPLSSSNSDPETLSIALSGPVALGDPKKGKKTDSRFDDDGDPLTPSAD